MHLIDDSVLGSCPENKRVDVRPLPNGASPKAVDEMTTIWGKRAYQQVDEERPEAGTSMASVRDQGLSSATVRRDGLDQGQQITSIA